MKKMNSVYSLLLLVCILMQSVPAIGQRAITQDFEHLIGDPSGIYSQLMHSGHGMNLPQAMFGESSDEIAKELFRDAEILAGTVISVGLDRAEQSLNETIEERRAAPGPTPITSVPVKKKVGPTKKRRAEFYFARPSPQASWSQFAFAFAPIRDDVKPDVKVTESDKEIKATGSDVKNFETKEAKGTRTQKVETKYIKDGKTFGLEIKDTQVIEAVSKPDGKNFRRELSLVWGAEVAACPDVQGVSAGTGNTRVVSKTTYNEGGSTVTMLTEFDLKATLSGRVNDEAILTHYDMQVEAHVTNTGYETALERGVINEIKLKDGRYGLRYGISGNTIEISDGKYGGHRTPAKMGTVDARTITPMTDAVTETVGKAIGPMIPSIWNSANEMYKSAQRSWRNYGCVEVVCKVPKLDLEDGEQVVISAESVHIFEKTKLNAQLKGEAFGGEVTPEEEAGEPDVTFAFTRSGEDDASFEVTSISKRGIGKGDIEFQTKKEESETVGSWTGIIRVESNKREEREKRSGANLAENGGHIETVTNVQLQLTGRLDRTVDANNAYIAGVTGTQDLIDYEYDRYLVDEGYCGANAVPYKGPKEITRTSITTATYGNDTRVFVEAAATGGTVTFSLPEINGTTLHKYVHRSSCADHDQANTNDATNEDVPTAGGDFSFSFSVEPGQRSAKGTATVRGDDGTVTVYSWELKRN
jgi:hypothetical protein